MLEVAMEPPEIAHSCCNVLPSLSFTSSSLQPSSTFLGFGPRWFMERNGAWAIPTGLG